MNYFLALRPSRNTRERLAAVAERLRLWGNQAKWVEPDDYHITLRYFGRLESSEVRSIPWSVNDVAWALCAPHLQLPGLGAFAGRREPRVVYAAVADPERWCADLQLDLHDALGVRPDRHFNPHITLCRPTGGSGDYDTWPRLLEAHGCADWGGCELDDLVFYESRPGHVPRYHALERWPIPRPEPRAARA